MAPFHNSSTLQSTTSLASMHNPTSRDSFYSSSTGSGLGGYGYGDWSVSPDAAVLPTVARGPSFCPGWHGKASWTRSSTSKSHSFFGSKAWSIWTLVTIAICGLVATLIYLVVHFRGLIPKNDIQRILATWGTPGSPSEAQAQVPASFSREIVPIACHSHNDEERHVPLYDALNVGCTSVEADVWLQGDDLLVGHSKDSLKPSRTLQSLYLDPLLSILAHQNPALNLTASRANDSAPLSGIYTFSPSTSLTLLVDLKTSSADTLPVLTQQLSALRSRGLLTRFDGSRVLEGPVTIVGTGNTDFRALVSNTTYRDIFFDAPLDQLWGEDAPGNATLYTANNSYYASVSFAASIGGTWLGGLAPRQLYKIRGQIKGAHERGLKVRYWDTPGWPKGLRNHIWDVLWREGADVLNVDDLVGARDFL